MDRYIDNLSVGTVIYVHTLKLKWHLSLRWFFITKTYHIIIPFFCTIVFQFVPKCTMISYHPHTLDNFIKKKNSTLFQYHSINIRCHQCTMYFFVWYYGHFFMLRFLDIYHGNTIVLLAFMKGINTIIQQGHMKLIKSDCKDIYNVWISISNKTTLIIIIRFFKHIRMFFDGSFDTANFASHE